jgi:signal transduction histidine kinase
VLNAIYAVRAKAENGNGVGEGYSPQVTLTVSRRGEQLVFDVADNGIGMDDETRRRAFEPLFTTRARGTGIGLANVKKIIEEHSGDIILESRPGEGTRIRIGLPYGSGS